MYGAVHHYRPPDVKREMHQHTTTAAEWNKENVRQPQQHAANGLSNAAPHRNPFHSDKPPQQASSPPPPLQPLATAQPSSAQSERPYAYCYPRPSTPAAPVVPYMPPPTAEVPHSTNLSFRAVRPPVSAPPPPVLSKAAKKRQAAKDAAREAAQSRPPDDSTPTKRKRGERKQQPSTPESSAGRKEAGKRREKEAVQPSNQASLYNFFSSPQRRKDAADEQRRETDEDDSEEQHGGSEGRGRSNDSKSRKRRRKDDMPTLEQVEKEARKLVFSTVEGDSRHAASKAGRKRAVRVDEADDGETDETEEEQAEDDEFVQAPTRQVALGLYSSQADYNRNVLDALRKEYRDLSRPHRTIAAPSVHHSLQHPLTLCVCFMLRVATATDLEHVQCFWDQANARHAVSVAAVYFNGSTSYRWPSEQQKKRFRVFNRIGRHTEKRNAKTIDTVDIREHGVIKCMAVTFTFALRHHEVGDAQSDSKGLKFMLPTWHDKSEPELSEADRLQLSAVVQGMLALPIEKVMFEAKDLILVLMSSLKMVQVPRCEQLSDVQVACWLLDPNVTKDSDRSKYQLLPLVHQYLQRDSGYDTDVTDRPADILRGLFVDMEDVLLLWHAVSAQLALQRMGLVMQLEMGLLPVLAEMQYLGTRFDGQHFVHANNAVIQMMTNIVSHADTLDAPTPPSATSSEPTDIDCLCLPLTERQAGDACRRAVSRNQPSGCRAHHVRSVLCHISHCCRSSHLSKVPLTRSSPTPLFAHTQTRCAFPY